MGNKCEPHFCNQKEPKMENKNWMKRIPDNTPLSALTIPGTHNSCGFHGFGVVVTQSWSIYYQLIAGIRYFDLRLRVLNNGLRLHHGFLDQKINFDEVLVDFIKFLEKHPTETIIMAIQQEYDTKNSSKDINQLYNEYTQQYKDKIIEYTGNPILMGEMRGKIVFINVFHSLAYKIPCSCVQNDWVVNFSSKIFEKKRKIKQHFIDALLYKNTNHLYINYLSASSDYLMVSASKISEITNKIPFKYKGRLGIVLCDFPGEKLIQHLISQNSFDSSKNIENEEPKDSIIQSGDKIYVINVNSMKFLSLDKEGSFICNRNFTSYIIDKIDQSNKDLGIEQKIKLTHIETGKQFEFTLTKKIVTNSFLQKVLGVEKDKERMEREKTVRDRNYVLFYNIDINTNEKLYLCSDYSLKDKKTKVQQVIMTNNEDDNKTRWIIKKEF